MPYPERLKKSLVEYQLDDSLIQQVFEGFESIKDTSPKKEKVLFMRQAMKILDESLDYNKRYEIIDTCACCLGGETGKKVRDFAKSIKGKEMTLAEKIQILRETRPFDTSAELHDNDIIYDGVFYKVDDEYRCACGCIGNFELEEPISSTFCLCCAGHFRYHLQKALDIKLKTINIESSPIESMGKKPCVFVFQIIK
ncbi:MAG: hypothetical protein ACOZCL_15095 [Bacillota bacterium]